MSLLSGAVLGEVVAGLDILNKQRQRVLCEEGEIMVDIENRTNDDFEIYIGCDGSTVGAYMGNWQVTNLVRGGKLTWQFTAFNGYFGFTKTHQICILFNKNTKKVAKFSVYGGPAGKYNNSVFAIVGEMVTLNERNHSAFKTLEKCDKKDCYYYKMKLEGVD